ncbi:MAG: fumarylacetoacetate hydrolase family protein [Pigmentiphaga sp.]|uniref:fumarylacetoacetate hydrolase family protein n=1 Tax=Pigmentiphaga sp. TaxID=1977564 RepID=UPI0029A975F1|nr:fumarylacetoacetate hydrolase family protein [Pigmentiphaga sp.]MDX3904227.1 fumarylacetoacetate hydrolase family protein [Pigmentiphaga sp.]
MKIGRMATVAGPHVCAIEEDRVVDLALAAYAAGQDWMAPLFRDLRLFLAAGEAAREAVWQLARTGPGAPLEEVRLLPPIEAGSKILAHVVNYADHGAEGRLTPPEQPFFFTKLPGTTVAPGEPICGHQASRKVDYEAELAIVIGRQGRDIAEQDAYAYVAGYTICNDVSYRELQANEAAPSLTGRYGQNWIQGKSLDRSCPLGPAVALASDIPRPYPLRISCRVNGELRQDASTEQMIYKVPALIAHISRAMTLQPGDIIATGTPSGCGVADGRYLRPGDVVECEIERIGTLRNTVMAAI